MTQLLPEGFLQILLIAMAVTAVVVVLATVTITLLLKDRQVSYYSDQLNRAVLSEVRASYESQFAKLALQMNATEERWKDSNKLVLSGQQFADSDENHIVLNGFLRQAGIREVDLVIEPKLIFLLTPFTSEELGIYIVAQEACAEIGYHCLRGDEQKTTGDILSHVVRMILKADIIIANIGSRNANVFYELGIAQALGKKTILISKTLDDVPFDVAGQRIITFADQKQLASRLPQAILLAARNEPYPRVTSKIATRRRKLMK